MNALDSLDKRVKEDVRNANAVRDAMESISRATNSIPIARIEWLAIAFIASQTIGNLALLGIAVALLRGHP